MTMKFAGLALASCIGLGACASSTPGTATSGSATQAPSGITSSNGGGQRQLGNIPDVSINTTGGGATVGPVPNSKGNAY